MAPDSLATLQFESGNILFGKTNVAASNQNFSQNTIGFSTSFLRYM